MLDDREKIEKAELNLKIAKLELNQIKETINNKERSMSADLKGLNYEINIQEKNVQELRQKLGEATITADKRGVVVSIQNQIGQTVAVGEELVKIANLQSYKIEGTISDMHATKLGVGGQVFIRMNEETQLVGEIVSISPSVQNNIIQFNIRLEDKNHPLLRPNLKVDVFVQTAFKENVVRVKNGAFYKGGTRQPIFIKQDDRLVQREAEFGHSNFDWVEIVSGAQAGDEVVISDMSDYENHDQLKINN